MKCATEAVDVELLEATSSILWNVELLAKVGFGAGGVHLLHLLMLGANCKAVHVDRNRDNDLGAGARGSARAIYSAMRTQAGLDAFPLGTAILEPDFNLNQGNHELIPIGEWKREWGNLLGLRLT